MATSAISNTVTDGSSTPPGTNFAVNARLTTLSGQTGGFRLNGGSTEIASIISTTGISGSWTLNLENNSNIIPTGTYWVIEEILPSSFGGTREWAAVSSSSATSAGLYQSLANPIPTGGTSFALSSARGATIFGVLDSSNTWTGVNTWTGTESHTGTDVFSGAVTFTGTVNIASSTSGGLDWLNVKSATFGAVGDGVTDDTKAIQTAIDTANAAGGGVVYLPAVNTGAGKAYLVSLSTIAGASYCLRLRPNVSIAGSGISSLVKKAANQPEFTRGFSAVLGDNISQIALDNFAFDGNGLNQSTTVQAAQQEHAVFCDGVGDMTISRLHITNTCGDGVYLHSGSSGVMVRECDINDNSNGIMRVGINFEGASNSVAYANDIRNLLGEWGMKCEQNAGDPAVTGQAYVANNIRNCGGGISLSGSTYVTDVLIADNAFDIPTSGTGVTAVFNLATASRVRFVNNTVRGGVGWINAPNDTHRVLVGSNSFFNAARPAASGISLGGGSNAISGTHWTIANNILEQAGTHGIVTNHQTGDAHLDRIEILNNQILLSGSNGAFISGADNVTVAGNVFDDNGVVASHVGLEFALAGSTKNTAPQILNNSFFCDGANQTIGLKFNSSSNTGVAIVGNRFDGATTSISGLSTSNTGVVYEYAGNYVTSGTALPSSSLATWSTP